MPSRAIVPTPKTFAALVKAVREALVAGQARADFAYVESYHITGRLIDAHILFFQQRADYGSRVIPQVAEALGASDALLYRCLRFAREYPILARGPELSWTHYRLLLDVPDKTRRKALESAARKNHWTGPELELRVREANAINVTPTASADGGAAPDTHRPLVPQRGTPGLHLIVDRGPSTSLRAGDGLAVDLGFRIYRPLDEGAARLRPYKAGDIVRIASDGPSTPLRAGSEIVRVKNATKAELFTYAATLLRVVDGDTLVVTLEIAPEVFIEQKLRLRGLDCPEMKTPEGKTAKRFVDALVARTLRHHHQHLQARQVCPLSGGCFSAADERCSRAR